MNACRPWEWRHEFPEVASASPELRKAVDTRAGFWLLATVVALEAKATDDCLELLDLLMVTELLGKAERESVKEKARQHPRLARAFAKLATAVEVLLNTAESGELGLDEVGADRRGRLARRAARGGRSDRRARAPGGRPSSPTGSGRCARRRRP